MATPTVYVICDQNCKFESMTKEQILTAIAQAVETGEIKDVDTGFVTTIKTISGKPLRFFVGEQSEYDALTEEDKKNLFAIISNDATKEGIANAIAELNEGFTNLQNNYQALEKGLGDGTIVADEANHAKRSAQLQLPSFENTEYYYTDALQVVEQFTEAGLYYAQLAPTGGGTVRPLGVFYYCRYPSHMLIYLGGDDIAPSLRIKIYTDGTFAVIDLANETDVTENYKMYAAKMGV